MEAFLNAFVLDTEHSARIFGKVTLNVQHLECQQRGALHAHIMLWLDADSIDFATNSISAAIPTIDEHSTDLDRLLHTYVVTKQHTATVKMAASPMAIASTASHLKCTQSVKLASIPNPIAGSTTDLRPRIA